MKYFALTALAYCLAITFPLCKIVNGYERNIHSARASLQRLSKLPRDKNVMTRLQRVQEFILYHDLTNVLLHEFKAVCPSLYAQIDTISDYLGRRVDVYVRFIPRSDEIQGALAVTNLTQDPQDPHAHTSEYGIHTVSVKVTVVRNALLILAHEFGHTSHQVPHLKKYVDFYKRNYGDVHSRSTYLGHKPNDPGGQHAILFENQFRKCVSDTRSRTGLTIADPLKLKKVIEEAHVH